MTYKRLPTNLPAILRGAGLKVVEVDGWQTRGRPASTGDFDPVGVLCHHTATNIKDWTDKRVVDMLVKGRSDLPGPLSQLGLARDGTVYIVASGRCNHAGVAKPSGTVAGGDGNRLYIGIEAFNDGLGEPWQPTQYDAYVLLCAVLSVEVTGNSVQTVRGHKETSTSGKPDPRFDMNQFRAKVAAKIADLVEPDEPVITDPEDPETTFDGFGLWMWYSGKPTAAMVLQPGGWKRTGLIEKPSKIKGPSSEHRMLYARVETEQNGDQVLEAKFVRTTGDGTAYQCLPLSQIKDDWPFQPTHFEEGDTGAGGEWWVRLTGGSKPVRLTTRYAKAHTYHPVPVPVK